MLAKEILVVLIGGGLGSVSRFLLSRWVQEWFHHKQYFPWGIFVANIIGCFLIGILAGILIHRFNVGTLWRAGIMIGFLGGFTTFSSFSLDTVTLVQSGQMISAVMNVLLSVCVGLLATVFGLMLTKG